MQFDTIKTCWPEVGRRKTGSRKTEDGKQEVGGRRSEERTLLLSHLSILQTSNFGLPFSVIKRFKCIKAKESAIKLQVFNH